jgi:hypothetical protein
MLTKSFVTVIFAKASSDHKIWCGEISKSVARASCAKIARSKVTLAAGESARIKRIAIEGDGKALAARLEKIASGQT